MFARLVSLLLLLINCCSGRDLESGYSAWTDGGDAVEVISSAGSDIALTLVGGKVIKVAWTGTKALGKGLSALTKKQTASIALTEAERKGFRGVRGNSLELKNFHACGVEQKTRNLATVVNGRRYTGHVLDQMQNRGIPLSLIESTLRTRTKIPTYGGRVKYHDLINKVSVIVEEKSGDVITVLWESW